MGAMTGDLLLHNVRPRGGPPVDLLARDGRLAEIGPDLSPPAAIETVDGGGAIVIPGLVEAHTHLDKTLLGMGWYRNEVGPRLIDRIENERREKGRLGIDPARQSARMIVQASRMGTTHIRSHVDVDTEMGVRAIEGVMAARARMAALADVEIVAFPQSGLLIRPGTAALMEAALDLGAEVVGGLDPCAIDRDPKGHLDLIFGLAERYGRPVDIHLHEPGTMGAFSLELIVERTRALGMTGKVTISHAFCLGTPDAHEADRLIGLVADAGVHIATTAPASRPVPPVKKLRAAGVVVCGGSDGVRDTWGPYGNADMLERAMLIGLKNDLRRDDEVELALDICTRGGAEAMALDGYGLEVGCHADLVLLDAETVAEAVVARPTRRLVVKRGTVVAKNGHSLLEPAADH